MSDIHRSYRKIIEELKDLAAHPMRIHTEEKPRFTGWIDTGQSGSIAVNEIIDGEIHNVADWMLEQNPKARETHSQKEWRATVRRAFGPALAQINDQKSLDDCSQELKSLVKEEVQKRIAGYGKRGTALGCWLFSESLDDSFTIGPVMFESKSAWLDRALATGDISRITHRRLGRAFSGQSVRPRKGSMDKVQEESILRVLEKAPMVCTVTTYGLAPEVEQKRSILAARLALTSIALLWGHPSRVLDHFRISTDAEPRIIRTIPVARGRRMVGGFRWSQIPVGFPMTASEWNDILQEKQEFFDLAGEMIACWTSTQAFDQASHLLRGLSQSLFFFEKACREESDLMSIIAFITALESLTGGREFNGILDLLKARLGLEDRTDVWRGQTLKQVVKRIYRKARSRTLHGTNDQLLHDWSTTREMAESMARHGLVSCMELVAKNPTAAELKDLTCSA
ncbi:MAG: hypothetical protein OXF39_06330 [Nitrospira sp.]|nr:hypothetical protein [Nitrospira sp.]